jgi:hypothetical protein
LFKTPDMKESTVVVGKNLEVAIEAVAARLAA